MKKYPYNYQCGIAGVLIPIRNLEDEKRVFGENILIGHFFLPVKGFPFNPLA